MYQSPEIMRQLVDDRHAQRRRSAAVRRMRGSARSRRPAWLRTASLTRTLRVPGLGRRQSPRPVIETTPGLPGPAHA